MPRSTGETLGILGQMLSPSNYLSAALKAALVDPLLKGAKITKRAVETGEQPTLGEAMSSLPVTGGNVGGSALGSGLLMRAPTVASTRFPTAVKRAEDPLKTFVASGDVDAYLANPTSDLNTGLLTQYPGMRHLQNLPKEEATEGAIQQIKDNLVFLNRAAPEVVQKHSPEWYIGAGRFSSALAERHGIPRQNTSAAIAVLSPKKDWFENASLAERTADILFKHRDTPYSPEMAAKSKEIYASGANRPLAGKIAGKKLSQLETPEEKAAWIRLYDEAHNDRRFRSIAPDGGLGDYVTTGKGANAKVAWQSNNAVAKAVKALESDGSMDVISPLLGTKHKVRNFYNNVERPDLDIGATVDTHQVAGGLLSPLVQNDAAVMHNLATGPMAGKAPPNWKAAANSSVSGFQGTYPVFEEATRRAGVELGLPRHQAQSATWEPVRTLFQSTWKTPANRAKVADIWKAVDEGLLSPEKARQTILDLAGGVRTPDWAKGGLLFDPRSMSTY